MKLIIRLFLSLSVVSNFAFAHGGGYRKDSPQSLAKI